jgi:hypothetical protein
MANVLDEWFPRDPNERKVTLEDLKAGGGRTRFPHVEEGVRDLCDTFAIETGWTLDAHTRKAIIAGARDFERAIGDRPDLLRQAMAEMKSKRLTFSSPRSCITVARKLAEHSKPTSYIDGEYADFIEH